MSAVSVDTLLPLRDRMMPMLEQVAEEYAHRTPDGYPRIIDEPARGTFGLMLDASHALHITTDGQAVFAELMARSSRADARSSAGRQKYGGMPFNDRRPLSPDVLDQELRNLVAELLSRWNTLPRVIHITDT